VSSPVPTAESQRARFDAKVQALVGLIPQAVDYWDVHNFGDEPARWDYGNWHHAVMGIQLTTDRGPITITWTNTFHPYGIEVFPDPIERHLLLGDYGPQPIGPDSVSRWSAYLGTPIRGAAVSWDLLEIGPARLADGTIVEPAREVDVPTVLRLDFDTGSVWLVAAIPQPPDMRKVFSPGDEIMVVFTREALAELGF